VYPDAPAVTRKVMDYSVARSSAVTISSTKMMTPNFDTADCSCIDHGTPSPDRVDEREIDTDRTEGRYADVTLTRCTKCRRLWLRYEVEYEAFSRSGRWCEAVIDEASAATMTPEAAPAYLAAAPWHVYAAATSVTSASAAADRSGGGSDAGREAEILRGLRRERPEVFDDFDCRAGPGDPDEEYLLAVTPKHLRHLVPRIVEMRRKGRAEDAARETDGKGHDAPRAPARR
jgi:hypothetical protein